MNKKKAIKLPRENVCVLATGHITGQDSALLAIETGAPHDELPRVEAHAHGWLVCLTSDKQHVREEKVALRDAGFSKDFLRIFDLACKQGFSFINFDSAGTMVDGLPWHDW